MAIKTIQSKRESRYFTELLVAIMLFMILTPSVFSNQLDLYGKMFDVIVTYTVLLLALFAAFAARYKYGDKKAFWYLYNVIFVLLLVTGVSLFFVSPKTISVEMLLNVVNGLVSRYYLMLIYMLIIFMASLGTYFLRKENTRKYGFLVLELMLVVFFFEFFYVVHEIVPDDEVLQSFYAISELSHGINPYNASIAGTLFNDSRLYGSAITAFTTNQFVGARFTYPFLYEIISFPFFYVLPQTVHNLIRIDLPAEAIAFNFFLIIIILFNTGKKASLKPKFWLMFAFAILVTELSSEIMLLVVAFLILAYQKLDSKYAWLFIGLAASLQQELWLPCLLLLIYNLNNKGLKQGARTAIGALAVFLVINGYFIAIGPHSFFGAIFSDADSYQWPNIQSTIGYFLITTYHLSINALNYLFDIVMILLCILFALLNRKELVPVFAFIPYFFLAHSLTAYYIIPTMLLVFLLYADKPVEKRGILQKLWTANPAIRYALCVCIAILILACIAVVYEGHQNYLQNFSFMLVNQTMTIGQNGTTYSATLIYREPVVNSIYFGAFGSSANVLEYHMILVGFSQDQVLANNMSTCNYYSCLQSMNKITLNASNTSYKIHANIPLYLLRPTNNSTAIEQVYYMKPVIYYGRYWYTGNLIYGNTT